MANHPLSRGVFGMKNNWATCVLIVGAFAILTTFMAEAVVGVEPDEFEIANPGDNLNLGQQLSAADSLGGIIAAIGKTQLKALEDGSITNEKGTFAYNQYMEMPDSASVVFDTDSNQKDDPALYLKFADDYKVYTYRLSFPTALRTDVDSNDDWKDLDNKKITLLGKEYTIIGTDNDTGTLTLMGGAIQDTLNEGETKTYTINGVDYDMQAVIVTQKDVLFKVNGELTGKMQEASTYKLKDGIVLGVRTLLSQDFAGGSRLVEFYLGAKKVEIKDNQFSAGSAGTVAVDSTILPGVTADLVATTAGQETRISKIELQWNATDNYFVPVGGKLSGRLLSDDKAKLLLGDVDFEFRKVDFGSPEKIEIKPAANNKYKLAVPTKTGGDLNFYAFYSDSNAFCKLGKDDDHRIITTIKTPIRQNSQFIVSSNKYSHMIEVTAFDTSNAKVKFKEYGTADTFEVSTVSGVGTMYLDGFAYNFKADYNNKYVNITGSMGSDGAVLYTPNGAMVTLSIDMIPLIDTCILVLREDNGGHEDSSGTVDSVWVVVSDPGTGANQPINIGGAPISSSFFLELTLWDSKDNFQSGYTKWGTYIEYDSNPDQDTVTMWYPSKEAVADVFVTAVPSVVIPLPCVPKTCSQLNKQCGYWQDECGSIVYCGTCSTGEICTEGMCEIQPPCVPKTCVHVNKQCDQWDDGCGATLNCGSCSSGKFCNQGICEIPKPITFQKRFETGTFSLFSLTFEKMKIKLYERFSLVRNRLSGTMNFGADGIPRCSLNRFRLTGGNLSQNKVNITGTAELTCKIPVDIHITDQGVDGSYNGTAVFRLRNLE
jgi:hypothetical protein